MENLVKHQKVSKYYEIDCRFNGVYSKDNISDKIKDGTYVIYLDEYSDIGTPWIVLYALNNNVTYFDGFGIEHVPKEIKKFIGNKSSNGSRIIKNIFRIKAYD